MAELGPGDSFGIGLSALLSGAEEYYALDAKAHATVERNVAMLAEIVELFARREPVPDTSEFPNIYPPVEPVRFPEDILTPALLARTLSRARVAEIRRALRGEQVGKGIRIQYVAPWRNSSIVPPSSLDMAFSQAVLEHVDDLPAVYDELSRLVKRGGFMSHVIDYKSHGITHDWNGHWTLSDTIWRIIRGRRPYLINRWAHSQHVKAIREAGFELITELKRRAPGLPRANLATRFRDLTEDDIVCPGSFIQAVRSA